ncbi:glycosyltransferase [uncultured Amnibacterium sp.]|uniref:glycosyltransferase n=1 Tax=uncultured Amnibacterium sp. TaxID=1631851 RepID=UPI0035CA4691
MASVIVSTLAGLGAAEHAVSVAEALRARGHRVSVVTSEPGAAPYRRLGFEVHPVPEPPMPDLERGLPPIARRAHQLYVRVQRNVIEPVPGQWRVVERVVRDAAVDAVVTDGLFVGGSMLAARPRATRPAVIMLGFSAPWIPDPRVPPYGMGFAPSDDGADRVRAAAFELLAARPMARLSRSFNAEVERTFGVPVTGDLRASPRFGDVWAQLTVPRFEYPRADLPANFRFVGPLHPPSMEPVPDWWDPVTEPPVVAVRAGSAAAVQDLVVPTLRAFAYTSSTVIVAGVSRTAVARAFPGPIPVNVHFDDRMPWSRLLPQRTVVVSDGDYLHTQHALRHGIPVVVAGTLETDVETAARVAWSGAGIDLRSSRPSSAEILAAVERVRRDDAFRAAAARLAAQIAGADAESTICDLVEQHVARRVAR